MSTEHHQYHRPLIELIDVQKSYDGEHLIIPDMTLQIHRGEFLTLLGASGSGKTTILMMLAGFENPTRGRILMNGQAIQDMPAHRRGIGMVFQNYALFPHMSVAQNLAYPLRMRGVRGNALRDKVERAMQLVQLDGMAERKPAQLSGGQQQRVALARALVFEPDLVLMDEPLGALDKNLRERMQYEIKQIHRQLGVTVVYVTHDQGEAMSMSDRVAVLHQGHIAQLAPPRTLYEAPENDYVATFIGENNCLDGTVVPAAHGVGYVLQIGKGVTVPLPPKVFVAGKRCRVLVRPECVQLITNQSVQLCAQVVDMVYLGDHTRLIARLANGDQIVAKLSHGSLPSGTTSGATIMLGWHRNDMLVFRSTI